MANEPIAAQDWHTRAIVRVLQETVKHSVDPWAERTFRTDEELEMVQWGRAGRPIDRSAWWTSFDIDGAFIIESDNTEIVRIIDEVAPIESDIRQGTCVECGRFSSQLSENGYCEGCVMQAAIDAMEPQERWK